jgi:hypothetical protein
MSGRRLQDAASAYLSKAIRIAIKGLIIDGVALPLTFYGPLQRDLAILNRTVTHRWQGPNALSPSLDPDKNKYRKQLVIEYKLLVYVVMGPLSTAPLQRRSGVGLFLTPPGDFYMFCRYNNQGLGIT